jgi:hypothetical protein
MADEYGILALGLHLKESLFEPREHISGVVTLSEEVVVAVVGRHGVDGKHLGVLVDSTVSSREGFRVVSILAELCDSFRGKPGGPLVCENGNDGIDLKEILRVDHLAEIMVAFKRVDLPLIEVLHHVVMEEFLVALYVALRVVPKIVGWDITGPEKNIRGHLVHLFCHLIEGSYRYVAEAEGTVLTGRFFRVSRVTVRGPAAEDIDAFDGRTNRIVKIQVQVGELNHV